MLRRLILTAFLLASIACQSAILTLPTSQQQITMMSNGAVQPLFTYHDIQMDCSRPTLFIYQQNTSQLQNNLNYQITLSNLPGSYPLTITTEYSAPNPTFFPPECQGDCIVSIQNNCPTDSKYVFNTLTLNIGNWTKISYVVNCNAEVYYKPFEWGLFVLILIASIVITVATFYSKAWSYGGFGFEIGYVFVAVFNVLFLVGALLVFFEVKFLSYVISGLGSAVGLLGVMVCTNQFLFLFKSKALNTRTLCKSFRMIDLVSIIVGCIIIALYWVFYQNWVITDIISICTIVACIKLFKLTSLKMTVVFLGSVLLLEIIFSLVIHFSMNVSYNNLIINKYDSPIMVQLPSITRQLYRKCAWLPATSLILPGLLLSYLRRFDVSRSTNLYLLIGYLSFYAGSISWMLADQSTKHSLPFAIISEPVTILLVVMFSYRRNEIRTLWNGYFYDPELNFLEDKLVVDRSESDHLTELVADLKVRDDI